MKGNLSFQRLTQRHEVKRLVKGYARKCKSDIHKEPFITKKMYKKAKNVLIIKGLTVGDNANNKFKMSN